ncbi:MAG: 50S ribosomal protein L3 [Candidatus Dependentiae bacterium ADurb.Bin331]|nr:MAG: 50S ribosomal protein L3 [Candidatus Dependentiae bacterium ADurb.Bin331]
MLNGVWGTKIGMTQVFSEKNTVVPVTVIDLNDWIVTQVKTKERDGYEALQISCLRKRFAGKPFEAQWLKKKNNYFRFSKEVALQEAGQYEIGQRFNAAAVLEVGKTVDVFGITKGRGFQGVVKRHGFRGGSASHGPRFGRWPGSMGFMRSQGRVIKNKKLPGQMGCDQRAMKRLEVIRIESEAQIALIKGSVPGGAGSLVFMQKA